MYYCIQYYHLNPLLGRYEKEISNDIKIAATFMLGDSLFCVHDLLRITYHPKKGCNESN